MAFALSLLHSDLVEKQAVHEIMKCNDLTAQFGLALTESQALFLVETRSLALKRTGRIEFGGGVIDRIINAFCNSPYLSMHNYEETLHELLEVFYHYKNETLDLMDDDDLIKFMKAAFDGVCQGSLDLLAGRELYRLARSLRYGDAPDDSDDAHETDEGEEDGYGGY